MMKMKMRLYEWGIFLAALCIVLVLVFAGALGPERVLVSNDGPFHAFAEMHRGMPARLVNYWSSHWFGMSTSPQSVLPNGAIYWLLPEWCVQPGIYLIDTLLLIAAGYYLLRGRRLDCLPSALGGIAMGFSGYAFTLIAAGHVGNFGMMPCAVAAIAFIDRAVARRSLIHFAWSGLVAGLGFGQAQDVMLMFGLLLASYSCVVLVRAVIEARKACSSREMLFFGLKCFGGAILSLAVFVAVSMPTWVQTFTVMLKARESTAGKSHGDQWEFATNWSMPPEEVTEFVAPCVFGTKTGDPKWPYWGRLGRSLRWEETGRGLANLREHTVYLGSVQMLFLVFGLVGIWHWRSRGRADPYTADKLFWSAAWILTVILAMGRYAPLYKLFYILPHASSIRCPVKFLHLTEVATGVLFALGVQTFLDLVRSGTQSAIPRQDKDGNLSKRRHGESHGRACFTWWTIGFGAVSLVFFVCAAWPFMDQMARSEPVWRALGINPATARLGMSLAFIQAAILSLIVSGVFLTARVLGERSLYSAAVCGVLLVVVGIDSGLVCKRYVITVDKEVLYAKNDVVELLKRDTSPFRVMAPARDGVSQRMSAFVLPYYGFDVFSPYGATSAMPDDYGKFFGAFAGDIASQMRMWQLAGVRYLLVPAQMLGAMPTGTVEVVQGYSPYANARNGLGMQPSPVGRSPYLVVRDTKALSKGTIYYSWEGLSESNMVSRLGSPAWDPGLSVLVPEGIGNRRSSRPAEAAVVNEYNERRIKFVVDAAEDGILLVNDRWDESWIATVDGVDASTIRCNGLMRGVRVPEGRHDVAMSYRGPYAKYAILQMLVVAMAFITSLVIFLLSSRNSRKNTSAGVAASTP